MTHERIQEVLNEARQRFNALASLSDAIALLDLCHSFADNVACDPFPWCRPTITDCSSPLVERVVTGVSSMNETKCSPCSGALVIKNGRYGIDTRSAAPLTHDSFGREATSSFIPNDTYVSAYQNFTVITGVNGSGKSTYLKQIAIIIILAHCGSYVPADEAFIPIRDKLFTRLGNTDDQEHNISSFLQEMKESSFICNNVTDKSLVLIDELGRATSNEDGVAIAWAIAEHLLVRRAFTFFVTHYPQLCKLSEIYPNVQNQHLGVLTTAQSNEISYTHKILPGPCRSAADYGITMCTMCGWDKNAVHEVLLFQCSLYFFSLVVYLCFRPYIPQKAEAIHREVGNKLPDGVICQSSNTTGSLQDNERKAETILWDLAKHLVSLKESLPSLTNDAMRSYLHVSWIISFRFLYRYQLIVYNRQPGSSRKESSA
jgi:DNA mismatch repair protein MSH4